MSQEDPRRLRQHLSTLYVLELVSNKSMFLKKLCTVAFSGYLPRLQPFLVKNSMQLDGETQRRNVKLNKDLEMTE